MPEAKVLKYAAASDSMDVDDSFITENLKKLKNSWDKQDIRIRLLVESEQKGEARPHHEMIKTRTK